MFGFCTDSQAGWATTETPSGGDNDELLTIATCITDRFEIGHD